LNFAWQPILVPKEFRNHQSTYRNWGAKFRQQLKKHLFQQLLLVRTQLFDNFHTIGKEQLSNKNCYE